jgi:alkanesulfonate monooxygenase SsuD/methylene tetrahydromethanopterin reductase-like flavin-dependent oxidoreductase (luciferase family)
MLDRAGLEVFFMAQRGRGFGPSDFWGTSLDSLTTAAALATVTKQIRVVSTVHTAFLHPGVLARMGSTLDQVSNGRWGLNLVSGWSHKDFEMMHIPFLAHDERYQQTAEFVEVLEKFWTTDWFDYHGKYFTIKQGISNPKPTRLPPLYNAGSSPAGKDFTARYCDWYFTGAVTPQQVAAEIADVRARAVKHGRDIRFITYVFVLCRETEAQAEKEAEEILALGDFPAAQELVEGLTGQTIGTAASIMGQGVTPEQMLAAVVLGVGSAKFIGTPQQVARKLAQLQQAGIEAVGLTFRHVEEEMADFIDKVLPLLEDMGVRRRRTQKVIPISRAVG